MKTIINENVILVYIIKEKITNESFPISIFFFKFKAVTHQDVMARTVLFIAHQTVKTIAVISQRGHVQDV